MSPSRSIIRSSLGCKAEKGFPGRALCSNEDLPSINFSLSSKPRCNLRYPSSPMVSLKHVHPYAYGQFPLSLLASIRFYPIPFSLYPALLWIVYSEMKETSWESSPPLSTDSCDGRFPVYKKNSIPDKLPGIEFFIIKRSCEEGHPSIVFLNAPFPRERSGGDFPKLVLSFLRGDGHLLWFFFCFLVFGKGRRFKTHEYSKTHEKAVVIPCLKPEVRSRVITYLWQFP